MIFRNFRAPSRPVMLRPRFHPIPTPLRSTNAPEENPAV
jgi:hypothetical protein